MTEPTGSVYLDIRAHGQRLLNDISSQARKAADSAEKSLGGRITGALQKAGRVGGKALAGGLVAATAAAGVFAASTLRIGVEYQDNLNTMRAVTHATASQMQQASQVARDLGNDLDLPATSAADAAQAMTELAKGGLSASQAMTAAKGTLTLAAAAQVDGATAAQIQSRALNAFSLSADKAGHVADVLANASNAASGEITDFAFGLQASSAVAHQFGLSLDDTVTALAEFANNGISGSDAGTSLKTALLALSNPTDKAQQALDKLGVKAFDAKGEFVGLRVISEELATAHAHMSQQAFTAAVATAFGSDAARAAGILAKEGAKGFNQMAAAVTRSGGAAEVAASKMQGVGGAIEGLQSQLETVKIDVFNRAAPSIEAIVRDLSDRLPGAADKAFGAIDRGAALIIAQIPKARAAVTEFGPVVQSQLQAKLDLAAHAARETLLPALRGVVTIVREALPAAERLGRTSNDVLRAGFDAAAKVAQQFQRNSGDLGRTLSDVIGTIDTAGRVALPVLKVGLTVAADAARVLLSAVAGVHDVIAPIAPAVKGTAAAILLGVVAVKALSLAFKGLSSARSAVVGFFTSISGTTTKVTRAVQANLAAISVAATGSLDKGLTSASSRTARVLSGVGSTVRAVGSALPVLGIGVAAVGAAMEHSAQQSQAAEQRFESLFQTVREGGKAGHDAAARIAELDVFLGRTGGLFGASEFQQAKRAATEYQQSLSVTDRQQQEVTRTQNDLLFAVQKYGQGAPQVVAASNAYQQALAAQSRTQQQLNQAIQTTTQSMQAQQQAMQDAASADAQLKQSEIGVKQAQLDVATAAQNAAEVSRHYSRNSQEAQQASLALAQAQAGLRQQILGTAEQARQAAIAHARGKSAEDQAAAGSRAYRSELGRLVGTLAPGSPLRRELQQLISDLDDAARPRTSSINIVVHGPEGITAGSIFGPGGTRARASGGPVTAGTAYLTGEQGPELIVPRRDGYVIPAGATQKILAAAASTSRPSSGGVLRLDPADRALLMASADRPVVIQLDGRTIARAVSDRQLRDRGR